jgi:hypothetical protein
MITVKSWSWNRNQHSGAIMNVYKVVRVKNVDGNEKFKSLITAYPIEYKVGKKTYPVLESSLIFAFNNLEQAVHFSSTQIFSTNTAIFKAEAELYKETINLIVGETWQEWSIKQYWDTGYLERTRLTNVYPDTVFCKSITLLERIK